MSTQNIGFYEEMTKMSFQLPSNMHLNCSDDNPILSIFRIMSLWESQNKSPNFNRRHSRPRLHLTILWSSYRYIVH